MTPFIASVSMVKHTFSCMAMGVHHQAKAGGTDMRGSTVLTGAGDTNIQVEREKGEMLGQMHARKIKDAEDGWNLDFELQKVELGFGKTSLIVTKVAAPTPGAPDSKNASAADSEAFGGRQETGDRPSMEVCKQIINFIDQERQDGVALSKEKQTRADGRYAPEIIARKFPVSEEWTERMIAIWLKEGVIKNDVVDTRSKKKGDRKSTRLNSSHIPLSRMPSSA